MYLKLPIAFLLSISFILNGFCQHKLIKTTLPIPQGWHTETFDLPPAFAAQLPFKGMEELRFSPQWSKKQTTGYWSYCFLWTLTGNVAATKPNLQNWLKAYYSGLVKTNLKEAKVDTALATPVKTALHFALKGKYDEKTFEGQVNMLDYMTHDAMVLNIRIRVKRSNQKISMIYFEASPESFKHPIWAELDTIGKDVK